jgi:hypothetical protein
MSLEKHCKLVECSLLNLVILDSKLYKPDFLYGFSVVWFCFKAHVWLHCVWACKRCLAFCYFAACDVNGSVISPRSLRWGL